MSTRTHIRQLRPYTYKGKQEVRDVAYKNLVCRDINYLFSEEAYAKLTKQIDERDGYNLFYTMCDIESREMTTKDGKKYINKRAFIKQSVIPFDIDHILQEQREDYLPVVSTALGIPLTDMIVVYSGNGIQFIVKSAEEWSDANYFLTHKKSYLATCTRIANALQASALIGDVDTSVWSTGRLMRLPGTLNRKPVTDPFGTGATCTFAELTPYREMKGAGLQLELDTILSKDSTPTTQEYLAPDAAYIRTECLFMKSCLDGTLDVHEPQAYAFLGIAAFLDDGDVTAWEGLNSFSSPTIDRMDKAAKLEQARDKTPPRTCQDISMRWEGCEKCPHFGKVKVPLQLRSANFAMDAARNGELSKSPKEMEVVVYTLSILGIEFDEKLGKVHWETSDLIKEGAEAKETQKDIFKWNGKYWEKVTPAFLQRIREIIGKVYRFEATKNKVDAAYDTLLKYIPYNPRSTSILSPQYNRANFNNGTVHYTDERKLEFRSHNRSDFMNYVLPGDYTTDTAESNSMFETFLQYQYSSDTDKDEKIRCLAQMFGACLLHAYPRIFFLTGVKGAGKSSIIGLLSRLIGEENISHVPLSGSGFAYSNMVGKHINIVAELDSRTPMEESILKQIEDRAPITIDRKYQTAKVVPLPAIHIFACNTLPPNFEKSGALVRRISLVYFGKSLTEGEESLPPELRKTTKRWDDLCWAHNPQGILNFAIKGMHDLLESCHGHYSVPASGLEFIQEWQVSNDDIHAFIEDIKDGSLADTIVESPEDKISRKEIFQAFCDWVKNKPEYTTGKHIMANSKFFTTLREKGYKEYRHNTKGRFVIGFKLVGTSY